MMDDKEAIRSLLDVVNDCDNFPYAELWDSTAYSHQLSSLWLLFLPHDHRPHGFLLDFTVKNMPWTRDFRLTETPRREIHLLPRNANDWEAQCNHSIDSLLDLVREKKIFPHLGKKRDEKMPILGARFDVAIERSASSLFGIIGRGAHMNVYVRSPSGLKMWVPQRGLQKATYGGMLDNCVAGGVAAGEMPLECIVREAEEEAGLDDQVVREQAKAVGTVSYFNISDEKAGGEVGLMNPGLLYCYDLEVGEDAVFKVVDDDVHTFHLMTMEEAMESMREGRWKPASALVMLDFFVRHGIVTAENENDYAEIVSRLRRRLPFPTRPS